MVSHFFVLCNTQIGKADDPPLTGRGWLWHLAAAGLSGGHTARPLFREGLVLTLHTGVLRSRGQRGRGISPRPHRHAARTLAAVHNGRVINPAGKGKPFNSQGFLAEFNKKNNCF